MEPVRVMPSKGDFGAARLLMIAPDNLFASHSSQPLPSSQRIYLPGQIHADVRVPVREIELTPTKSYTGAVTSNDPVRVYDCSGPWGDPAFTGSSDEGLPALRADWIQARGDVAEYAGREVKPMDNGYLSGKHAQFASKAEKAIRNGMLGSQPIINVTANDGVQVSTNVQQSRNTTGLVFHGGGKN